MNKISAVVIARNEEKKIERCLEGIKWCDEIVFVDQSSDDKTVEIAKRYTSKIFVTENSGACEFDREFAISKAKNNWILMIDADEIVDEKLKDEIIISVEKDVFDVFYIPRKNFFSGKWIKGCGWYPSYVPRLFKKGYVRFEPKLHMDGKVISDKVGYLQNPIMHFSYEGIEDWFEKANRYTSIIANEYYTSGMKYTITTFIKEVFVKPFYFFILKYILLKGFKDGWRGFFISISSALTLILSYLKFIEIKEKNDLEK